MRAPDGCLLAMEKLHHLVLPLQPEHWLLPGRVRQAGLVRDEQQHLQNGVLRFKYTSQSNALLSIELSAFERD